MSISILRLCTILRKEKEVPNRSLYRIKGYKHVNDVHGRIHEDRWQAS